MIEIKDLTYLTDYYDEKIQRVKDIDAPLNFIFYTDPHNGLSEFDAKKHPGWYEAHEYESALNSIASLQYIIDRLPGLKCVVCGGDLGCEHYTDPKMAHQSIKDTANALYDLTIPAHIMIGNHDDCVTTQNSMGTPVEKLKEYILYPKDLHSICMKNNPTDKNYYYVDFDDLGYRFVFLNTSDHYYGFDDNNNLIHPGIVGVSREQVMWFKEAVKTNNRVIVFSHSPISIAGHYPDCAKGREDMLNGPWLWHEMKKAPNVIASISGHLHYDNVVYDGPVVAISTMAAGECYHGQWDIVCPRREYGTITETAFDVVSVTEKVVYCTRFGIGNDRAARIMRNWQKVNDEWVK